MQGSSKLRVFSRFSLLHPQSKISRRYTHREHFSTSLKAFNKNWIDIIQEKVRWTNQQYETMVGISDIRQIQDEVLRAEAEFLETTAKRKHCQDRIDELKQNIKDLWDKLESTPRSSDNYINLRTDEHRLVREQVSLDVELKQLKDKEQVTFDTLSRLLRRSHELERLRQERSKSLQIISVGLTVVGSVVALVAQRARNQSSQLRLLEAKTEERHQDLVKDIESVNENLKNLMKVSINLERKIEMLDSVIREQYIAGDRMKLQKNTKQQRGWFYFIPSLSSILGYFY